MRHAARSGDEIAKVSGTQRGEVKGNVAIGVAAAVINGPDFLAAQKHRRFLREREVRRARHVVLDHMPAGIRLNDDFRAGEKLRVASGVVSVMVRIEYVFDWQARYVLHSRHDLGVVLIETVIYQNDAFTGNVHGD